MRFDSLRGDAAGPGLYLLLRGFFAPAQVLRLLGLTQRELDSAVQNAAAGMQSPAIPQTAASNTFNYAELKRYLHDQLLRDTDTFSMAHSLEVRVPFLDHALVDYAIRIAPHLKIHNHRNPGLNKGLLIRAIHDPVLQQTGAMKKRGFSFPLDQWMKRYSGQLEEMASGSDGVDRKTAHGLWDQFRAGRLHWSRAWALAALGTRA
jgi:asparagine synthase (glutamine-hydrolysing)